MVRGREVKLLSSSAHAQSVHVHHDEDSGTSGPAALAVSNKLQHVWSESERLSIPDCLVSLLFVTQIISDKRWHYYTSKPLGCSSDGRTGSAWCLCYQAWVSPIQIQTLYITPTHTSQPSVMLSGRSSRIQTVNPLLFYFSSLGPLNKVFMLQLINDAIFIYWWMIYKSIKCTKIIPINHLHSMR